MELITGVWEYVIPFLVVLTILVFVHELGHYAAARHCGVRIETFSVGFGPELFGRTDRHGTRWKFSAIPIGGYVKMFGERPEESPDGQPPQPLTPEEQKVAFGSKSLAQRAYVVFAGPAANFIYAIVVLAGMFSILGQPYTPTDIAQVMPGSAAEKAGFKKGDEIIRIGSTEIERFEQLQWIIERSPGVPLDITVRRDGRDIVLKTVPDTVEMTNRFGSHSTIGRLGVSRSGLDRTFVRYDPLTAVWRATTATASMVGEIFKSIWQIISGTRSAEELGGPLRIAQMSGDMAQAGIASVIMFTVFLSVNLGLINLFPIPMLDGGHLMFYLFEGVRGRPLGERAQEYGFRIGLALVLSLMLFVTWNDLIQLRVVEFLVDLVT